MLSAALSTHTTQVQAANPNPTLTLTPTLTRYEQALRRVAEQVALGFGLALWAGFGFGLALALGFVAEQVELDA